MFMIMLLLTLLPTSLESCLEDLCQPWDVPKKQQIDSVFLGTDETGCMCKEIPGISSICFGRDVCREFPRSLNFTTKKFSLQSSGVFEIKPGDLVKVRHVEVLEIQSNHQLSLVAKGSFWGLHQLKELSISDNSNLKVLESGCFDGLVNLQCLSLKKNAFVVLASVTAALTNLPQLKELDLSENSFQTVGAKDFAVLASSPLHELFLNLCELEYIETTAFNPLTKLTTLRLAINNFNSSIAAVIQETTGKVPLDLLDLYSTGLTKTSSKELLEVVAKTNITKLCLGGNHFGVINSEMFPNMPNLEVLDLRRVLALNITNDTFANLPELKSLFLSSNKLAFFPEGALLPRLKCLDLQRNSGHRYSFNIHGKTFINMKELEQLSLSFNALYAVYNSSFMGLENLRTLELKNATIFKIWDSAFEPLNHLEGLNLENNFFLRNYTVVSKNLFKGLVNLRELYLGGCSITFLNEELFKDLPKLEYLGLERNNLMSLPTFRVLLNLRSINLSDNALQPWKEQVFLNNHLLEEVRVGSNKLTDLTPTMLQEFNTLKILVLENNPFTCDCSFSWNQKKILKLIENQTVLCASGTATVATFHQDCLNVPLLASSVITVLLLVTAAYCIYHFRWHLKYWLFLTRLHLSRTRDIKTTKVRSYTNYHYDAFVSYSNEDRNFVVRLVAMLENHPPFIKLCVYERDFEIGTIISENVLESVAKSRKTVLVISDSYAKSQWCRWESQIAEHHRLFLQNEDGKYADDSVVLIKLGPVNESHLTPILKYLLKTRIYLPWDVEEKKQKAFWEKLRAVLAPPQEVRENTHL